jgi:hypothetical protein
MEDIMFEPRDSSYNSSKGRGEPDHDKDDVKNVFRGVGSG